jgi:hypothetical protein
MTSKLWTTDSERAHYLLLRTRSFQIELLVRQVVSMRELPVEWEASIYTNVGYEQNKKYTSKIGFDTVDSAKEWAEKEANLFLTARQTELNGLVLKLAEGE